MNITKAIKTLTLGLLATLSLGGIADAGCPWTGNFNDIPASTTSPHSYIKGIIRERGEVRIAALTDYGAGVVVSGRNNWAISKVPTALKEAIEENDKLNQSITDVHITERGSFVAIFGTNGYSCMGAPTDFSDKLKQLHSASEEVLSACFNDRDEYIIVTEKTIYHNLGDAFGKIITQTNNEYGLILSASMTNSSCILCAQRGVFFVGAPKCISEALNRLNYVPRCIKYTDDGEYIITDGVGSYSFSL